MVVFIFIKSAILKLTHTFNNIIYEFAHSTVKNKIIIRSIEQFLNMPG
jgi:hypothetical protein